MIDNFLGWQCPNCGQCWAPWIQHCDCNDYFSEQWIVCPICGICHDSKQEHNCDEYSLTITAGGTDDELQDTSKDGFC